MGQCRSLPPVAATTATNFWPKTFETAWCRAWEPAETEEEGLAQVDRRPTQRKGASTVKYPVATTWVLCLNATNANYGEPPPRKAMVKAAIDAGVNHNTASRQVTAFLAWFNSGRPPEGLPRRMELVDPPEPEPDLSRPLDVKL